MTNRADGLLVSIDGPGGVGKTATIEHLTTMLGRAGLSVHRTAQPSTGRIVLCDRYLASGLVVQRADGLDLAFLAGVNAHADPPDLAVILTADPDIIARRIAERGVHNR